MLKFFLKFSNLTQRIAHVASRRPALIQAIASSLALALGFWGWMLQNPPKGHLTIELVLTNLHKTIQLITINFPSDFTNTKIVWQLQIARLLVPITAALATFNVVVSSITRPARLALLPLEKNHIIIFGTEGMANSALTDLAKRGSSVVAVSSVDDVARREVLESMGLTYAVADPLLPKTFDMLNVKNAAAIFLTDATDTANLNMAMLAMDAVKGRSSSLPPLLMGVLIRDDFVARQLDQAFDQMVESKRVRFRRLSIHRESIRLDIRRFMLSHVQTSADKPAHFAVFGLEGDWKQVISQLVMSSQSHGDKPPQVSLILRPAEQAIFEAWKSEFKEMNLVVDFKIIDCAEGSLLPKEQIILARTKKAGAVDCVIVLRTDSEGLATAMALRQATVPWIHDNCPIHIHQSVEDNLLGRLSEISLRGSNLKKIVPFGGVVRADVILGLVDARTEVIAKKLHEAYMANLAASATPSPYAKMAWEDLPENIREANRAPADYAELYALEIAPSGKLTQKDLEQVSPEMIAKLAKVEHRRWMADRLDRGWRYGAKRDDVRRSHTDIVPFGRLSIPTQKKDETSVLNLLKLWVEHDGIKS
jgi:hypothetical protein